MKHSLFIAIAIAAPVLAQTPCSDQNWGNNNHTGYCEVREHTIADTGKLTVDSAQNGGIKVTGADRSNILVRARVSTHATTADEAKALAQQVRVQAVPGDIRADGPASIRDRSWAVSYEILVPRRSGLALKAHNGGIHITDVEGIMEFHTTNGGVHLKGVGGDVQGRTVNGGLHVELAGNTWRGNQLDVQTTNGGVHLKGVGGDVQGRTVNGGLHVELAGNTWRGNQLDVQTTNGGVHVNVPDGYAARFETSTVNGRVHADLPGANVSRDRNNRNVSVTLGSGGALVRLVTTNGGIHLGKS